MILTLNIDIGTDDVDTFDGLSADLIAILEAALKLSVVQVVIGVDDAETD